MALGIGRKIPERKATERKPQILFLFFLNLSLPPKHHIHKANSKQPGKGYKDWAEVSSDTSTPTYRQSGKV